jgi:diaminopimelate decarboxylase
LEEALDSSRLQQDFSLPFSQEELYRLSLTHNTPFYIFDGAKLREAARSLTEAYSNFVGPVRIAYSMKANFNPSIVRIFVDSGLLFDIATQEELYFLTRCGGSPSSAIYTSVGESRAEYETVLRGGVGLVSVSSYSGLQNLIDVSEALNVRPSVLVRVNPEVSVKAEVRASMRHGKFGVPFNTQTRDSATGIIREIWSSGRLNFAGFHFHLGSQVEDPSCFVRALDRLESFIIRIRRDFPIRLSILDIGGGTPVNYNGDTMRLEDFTRPVVERLNRLVETTGDRFTLVVESGRFLTAEAGFLVSKVLNVKEYGNDVYAILDIGYHLLLDAALLHQPYPQVVVPRGEPTQRRIHLAGMLCDTDDVFPISRRSVLDGLGRDKLVVFGNVGAYSIVFNMPFHCQVKPPILLRKENGEYVLIRKRGSVEDLFREESAVD